MLGFRILQAFSVVQENYSFFGQFVIFLGRKFTNTSNPVNLDKQAFLSTCKSQEDGLDDLAKRDLMLLEVNLCIQKNFHRKKNYIVFCHVKYVMLQNRGGHILLSHSSQDVGNIFFS